MLQLIGTYPFSKDLKLHDWLKRNSNISGCNGVWPSGKFTFVMVFYQPLVYSLKGINLMQPLTSIIVFFSQICQFKSFVKNWGLFWSIHCWKLNFQRCLCEVIYNSLKKIKLCFLFSNRPCIARAFLWSMLCH